MTLPKRTSIKTHVNLYLDMNLYLLAKANGMNLSSVVNDLLKSYMERNNIANPKVATAMRELHEMEEKKKLLEDEIAEELSIEKTRDDEKARKFSSAKERIATIRASGVLER